MRRYMDYEVEGAKIDLDQIWKEGVDNDVREVCIWIRKI